MKQTNRRGHTCGDQNLEAWSRHSANLRPQLWGRGVAASAVGEKLTLVLTTVGTSCQGRLSLAEAGRNREQAGGCSPSPSASLPQADHLD